MSYWWAHPDLNQGPTGYEPAALPLSYGPVLPSNITIIRSHRQGRESSESRECGVRNEECGMVFRELIPETHPETLE